MNKPDLEKEFDTLEKTISNKKYKLETLLTKQKVTEEKLREAKRECSKLYDLTKHYRDQIDLLKMQIEITSREIDKVRILQKNLEAENEVLGERRVYELELQLANLNYKLEAIRQELEAIKNSFVRCHRKDAPSWREKLSEKEKEENDVMMDIDKTKMQLEFAKALLRRSENRKANDEK